MTTSTLLEAGPAPNPGGGPGRPPGSATTPAPGAVFAPPRGPAQPHNRYRAELFELLPRPALQPGGPVLTRDLDLPDTWWVDLRGALTVTATVQPAARPPGSAPPSPTCSARRRGASVNSSPWRSCSRSPNAAGIPS